MVLGVADDLIVLVAFARDENQVAGARLSKSKGDGGAAVGLDMDLRRDGGIGGFVHAGPYLGDNGIRVFVARIVRGDDGDLGLCRRQMSHDRALAAITVAAT